MRLGLRDGQGGSRQQLPAVASALGRAVDAGSSLADAIGQVGEGVGPPLGPELLMVRSAVLRGVPIGEALGDWASHSVVDDVELLVVAAVAGVQHGGDLAGALEAVAVTSADRLDAAAEARALTAQAVSSAAVLVALPLVGSVVFCAIDQAVARTLFATPLGWTLLVLGISMDLAGAAIMRLQVRRALR